MIVRRYVPGDLDRVLAVAAAFHAESPLHRRFPFDPDRVRVLLEAAWSNDDWLAALAENEEGKIVGLLLMYCVPMFFGPAREVGDLTFYVAPEARGGRVAGEFLNLALLWAEARDARVIRFGIMTGIEHKLVVRWFKQRGFSEVGTLLERVM